MTALDMLRMFLPEAVLLCGALLLMALGLSRRGDERDPHHSAAISAITILLACLAVMRGWDADAFYPLVSDDALARLAKGVVLGLSYVAVLQPHACGRLRNAPEFHALGLFAIAGLSLAVATEHLLMVLVGIELASLSLYLMVGFTRRRRAAEAALKYFLFGGVSAAFMVYGMSLLYAAGHVFSLRELAVCEPSWQLTGGLAMVLVGLGFKLAVVPFHYWAPDVYEGGVSPAVGLVAGASKFAVVVVLARVLIIGFPLLVGSADLGGMVAGWKPWVAMLAAVSMVLGNVLALAQKSVRRLLAYSSVANAGYLLVGLCGGGGQLTVTTTLFHTVVYALGTLGALAVTCAVERRSGNDHVTSFAGLWKYSPIQAVVLLTCLASLAGIPPLAGFVGKFAMFSAALRGGLAGVTPGLTWLVALGAVMSAVSFYYYLRVLKQAFAREPDATAGPACDCSLHWLAMGVPAIALVVLGVLPSVLMSPIARAVAQAFW